MSTLLVTLEFPPDSRDGISSWAWDLAWALHRSGESTTVLAKQSPGAEQADAQLPFRVIRMRGRSWGRWQDVWARIAGGRHLDDHGRVIFSTWQMASRLGPAARAAGCRVGIAAHGSDLTRLQVQNKDMERADQAAHCWLPVSQFLASELERLGVQSTAVVLPMPLQTDHPVTPPDQREGLLMLARMTPLKGVDRAISLARELGQSLVLIGDGPTRQDLESEAPEGVEFLGSLPREAAMARLARSRAVLLLPRTAADGLGAEGLGLCLLEAAARGVPVIGCATGGVPEAVGPGLLIDPEAPDLEAIRTFLDDPEAGSRACAWVQSQHGQEACLRVLDEALR